MTSPDTTTRSPFYPPANWLGRQQPSEVEYIAKLRKSLRFSERWRWWIVGFYGTLIGLWVVMASQMFEILQSLAALTPASWQATNGSFALGIVLGAKVGFWILFLFNGIAQALGGSRQQRLLIEYYDRAHSGSSEVS